MENFTKTPTYGIDPNKADKSLFDKTIDAIPVIKEKGGDENLRMGAVLNAICAVDSTYNAMSPDMAFMNFFGYGTTLDDVEAQLLNIRELTRNSEPNALADFKKLSPEKQEKRILANSPDAKKRIPTYDNLGLPIASSIQDNPNFDLGKAREEYETKLANKDTFNGFIRLKNAGLSGEIIRDVMRFKTAFDTREDAAEAYVDKILSTDNEDWARQFIVGVNTFSPTLKRGLWERVGTQIGEDSMDRYFNIKDYAWGSNTDGAVMFSMAQEMGIVDKYGDLASDPDKISELQKAYEQKQNIGAQHALGAGAWSIEPQNAYKNTDVQKLFAEGKKRFERVKAIRGLMNASRTRFDYSDGEWKTFEEALVNGATSLEYMGIAAVGGLVTRNPWGGIMLSSAAMYVDEASSMYADLRYDGNVNESSAAFLSAFYGVVASRLEQVQLKSLGRAFTGSGSVASTFKEYVKQGFSRSVKDLLKEGGIQTFTELATSTDAFATKLWAKNHENATFEEQQLWDEYREECSQIIKTMPLITLGFWGAGAPFRARGYLKDVGADLGSAIKAIYTPSKIIENNVRTRGAIQEAENYYAEIKEKFGKTVSDREWLEKYNGATSEEERTKLLKERYPDDNERYEASQMLNPQTIARIDGEATRKILEMKAEVARKLSDDGKRIKGGDETSGLSDLDAMETDADGNSKYSVLESAIDTLDMRGDIVFVKDAQELANVSGLSIEQAQSQMSREGAKGFFEDKSGKIVVIPSHFKSGEDALQTFTHEYGHKIMEKIRKTDLNGYNRMCDEVLSLVGGENLARATLPESYSTEGTTQYISDSRAVAEEVLMRVVENVSVKKVLDTRKKSVWARFKNWFARLFDEKTFADMANDRIAQIALNVLQKEKSFNVKLPSETAAKTPSKTWKAKTPEANGAEASGEYTIIDASKLTASTDEGYDDVLQPRNRSRQASKEQVLSIATHLDPERLGGSPTTDLGAPIVDSRGMVVSGNGRILAIRQAYDSGKGEEYGNYVRGRAAEMGIEIPEGAKNPVLVRRVDSTGEMSMEEFAARSNKSQVAGMSIAEQAVADGRRIVEANLLDMFFPDANDNVLAVSNSDFYNAFLNQISGAEMYRNSDGSVRQNLAPRIRAAVLSAMLNPDKREVIERLLDNPDGYNALINGLMQCAANVAELTQKPQYDISDNLSEAVELYIEMHDKGQTVAEFVAQTDMFREPPSDETMFLCKLFEENQKTSSGISGVLKQYAEECRKIDTTTQSIFGEEDPSKLEKLRSAYNHYATDLATKQTSESGSTVKWRDTGEPSPEDKAEAQKQYKEVYDKYFGTPLWHKAPNGKESNLTEKQWVQVRTPNFKKWFGDWETLALINEVKNMPAVLITQHEALDKAGIKEAFKSFEEVKNKRDDRRVVFPSKSAGKIYYHKGFDTNTIIKNFNALFEKAVPILSEKEKIKEGHKVHGNIESYIHYVNKFTINSNEYYIRFTVPTIRNNKGAENVHSSAISEVSIYKNGDSTLYLQKTAGSSSPSFIDDKIADFLNSVKQENVSKVVDENGEPLVVYHGTNEAFNIFKHGIAENSGDNFGYLGTAHYATNDEAVADSYGDNPESGRTIPIYLNIRNPYNTDNPEFTNANGTGSFAKYLGVGERDVSSFLKSKGHDGVIAKDNEIDYTEFAFYDSSQAKSATDNIGTFNEENPDIRWRDVSPEKAKEAIDMVVDEFGTTQRYKLAGYILPDARMIDLSYGQGRRTADHRKITIPDDVEYESGTDKMEYFMDCGVIRFAPESNAFNIRIRPTSQQENRIRAIATSEGGEVILDLEDKGRLASVEYESGTKPLRIIGDIRRFYDGEDIEGGIRWRDVEEQIKTPQFKAWFGNSQVVDKNGKPLHVFHGQDVYKIDVFDRSKGERSRSDVDAFFFTDSRERAVGYSIEDYTTEAFLRIETPVTIDFGGNSTCYFLGKEMRPSELVQTVIDLNEKFKNHIVGFEVNGLSYEGVIEELERVDFSLLYADKIDGVIMRNINDNAYWRDSLVADNFVVFEANQIKDATGENNGDFSNENPSIKWRDDTVLMPVDINILVARNIDTLMNAIRKSHKLVLAKKTELERKYPESDKNRKSKIENDLRLFILKSFSSELVPIAMLSDEDAKFYNEQFEVEDRFVYTGFAYAIEHYFNRHPNTPIENYFLLPDTIFNPDKKKEVGREDKDKLGNLIYSASQAFIKEYDKWHVSTIKVDAEDTSSGKKLVTFKNFYDDKREPYKNKRTIEDFWKNATSSSNSFRGRRYIPNAQKSQSSGKSSKIDDNGQVNSTHLKSLLRQERSENPVIWASIVLAREILLDRKITATKLDKVLPSDKFDGTKREYAVNRARQIAEQCKATQTNYKERLNEAVQLAECDVYWNQEVVDEMYRSFRKDGEEYGIVKQKLLDWLKTERQKDLENVKGLSADELGIDVADAIQNAMEADPERKPREASEKTEDETEELEETTDEGIDDEILGAKEKLAPSTVRDIITKVRTNVTKAVKKAGKDEATRRRVYRNTLVNVLKDAAKQLVYGKEREAIMKKLSDLSQKGYAVIKIKDGERAGQKIDNFTLRAEHIALRIFNRGVRDTKKALIEKFDAIIKRKGKKPSRMVRDDKRIIAGAVQARIYKIGQFAEMTDEELESEHLKAADRLNNVDKHFVEEPLKDGETRPDVEDVRAEVANTIRDIQMFGNFVNKSRAEMSEAVDFLENLIESETEAQKLRVQERKEKNAATRKIIMDALKMSKHNAAMDSKIREATRRLLNLSLPFDSWLAILGEASTGEVYEKFEEWRKDFVSRVDKNANAVANKRYQEQQKFIELVENVYGENFHDALKRLLKFDAKYETFSNGKDMKNPMCLANVLQLYASALQENYIRNVYKHRAVKSAEVSKLEKQIDDLNANFPDRESQRGEEWEQSKKRIDALQREIDSLKKGANADYIARIEKVISEKDKLFIDGLRKLYADGLPAISEVSKRVIGLPIEQADALYMPAKIKRGDNLGEGTPQVPVIPKTLSQRVPHLRDFDETADPIKLFIERSKTNAQFEYFSELYIEMRGIFGSEDIQDLIKQRCGADVLSGLKNFIADIATGETRGFKSEEIQKANGLVAAMLLGFNLGSGLRQILPGVFSWATYVGLPQTAKNFATFFTPEGFSAAREIALSENGRRRFAIGNMQILEEMLSTPDQNKFWAAYKRYALIFNRSADMLSIMLVGQGVYRSGTAHYLKLGFSEKDAKERAMADMWQIAERTQASGRIHNMSLWQRRAGDVGKTLGMFSSPPQLQFSKIVEDLRRAIALGIKSPEGRAAAWNAARTIAKVSLFIEGSYAISTVLWNALLKGFFDDDDKEYVFKQMALGPFGGLFLFGRIIEGAGSNYGASLTPLEQLSKPLGFGSDFVVDAFSQDWEESMKDLDKLIASLFSPWRDVKKARDARSKN